MEQRNHDAVLVTLADRNFIDQAKQLFSSVYWNAGWKGDYMLLSHEIPEKDLKWFRNKGILVKKCRALTRLIFHKRPPAIYDKIYLFTPEFKKWKNVVFIDGDIIVKVSLEKLGKVKGFWAVEDRLGSPKLESQFILKDKKILINGKEKLNMRNKAFNSGVMAFSTDIITDSSFLKLKELMKNYIRVSKHGDQPILNLFFYKKWKKLPYAYNIFPYSLKLYDKIKISRIKGICLHFVVLLNVSNSRPWDKNNPFYSEWKRNLDKADLIDLNNIPLGKKWSGLRIAKESLLAYRKYFVFFRRVFIFLRQLHIYLKQISRRIYRATKNFIIYQVIARLKVIPDRILGVIGQLIKAVSPALYNKLKGKNGTKKS